MSRSNIPPKFINSQANTPNNGVNSPMASPRVNSQQNFANSQVSPGGNPNNGINSPVANSRASPRVNSRQNFANSQVSPGRNSPAMSNTSPRVNSNTQVFERSYIVTDKNKNQKRKKGELNDFIQANEGVFIAATWIVLIIILCLAGIWGYLHHQIATALPHTFGWRQLLRTYGSYYTACVANETNSGKIIGDFFVQSEDNCIYSFTTPCITLISIVILFITFIKGTAVLFFNDGYYALFWLKFWTTCHTLFFICAIMVVSVFYDGDINSLKTLMSDEMKDKDTIDLSKRWELSQTTYHCCGIDKKDDWGTNDSFPVTCCDNIHNNCSNLILENGNINANETWNLGCYPKEYHIIYSYGAACISLLVFGYIFSIMLLIFSMITCPGGDERKLVQEVEKREEIQITQTIQRSPVPMTTNPTTSNPTPMLFRSQSPTSSVNSNTPAERKRIRIVTGGNTPNFSRMSGNVSPNPNQA